MTSSFIGITQGDEKGIGPEIITKALSSFQFSRNFKPIILGDPKYFSALTKKSQTISILTPSPKHKNLSYGSIKLASFLCFKKKLSAIVTAPVNKHAISKEEEMLFLGHTEFFKEECEKFFKKKFYSTMLFSSPKEYLSLATTHCSLKNVSQRLTSDLLKKTIQNTFLGLRYYFSTPHPKLAILGLNPHAGDNGLLGQEEKKLFPSVLRWAKFQKISLKGPFSADSFFAVHSPLQTKPVFDGIIALYHDQGLIPFKLKYFHEAVNVTLGLPMVRTSVDHGVGYDISGKNIANPSPMISAIKTAVHIVKTLKGKALWC